MKKAQEREREQEIIYERKLAKERNKDDHLYAGKDKFVTSAYKKKLAEQAKWMEEERLRQLREEKEDVCIIFSHCVFYFSFYYFINSYYLWNALYSDKMSKCKFLIYMIGTILEC